MAVPIDHRWRTQIALLHEACARRTQVRVAPCGPGPRPHATAALLRIEGRRLYLLGRLEDEVRIADDERVEIAFAHEDAWVAFRTVVLPVPPRPDDVWAVQVPLRLVRRDMRREARIEMPDGLPVTVRLTNMYDRGETFVARLRNVSIGGLAVRSRRKTPPGCRGGQPHWIEFALPGSPRLFEFAARLAYLQNLPNGEILQGWSFYATDDNAAYLEQLEEIDRCLGAAYADDGAAQENRG